MADTRSQDIALFRYRLIAPVLNETGMGQMVYFRSMSEKEFDVPHLGKTRYKPAAFKKWLRNYRIGGFDALLPKKRIDKGRSRKIDENLGRIITEKSRSFPFLSSSGIYRILISEGEINPGIISEGTLRKYIKDNKLKASAEPTPRKRFEKEHINELWIADSMHGPYILHEQRKKKVFLISIIDDCSRLIVGGGFFLQENSLCLEMVVKEAITRFGLPHALYCDNGSIFVSSHLQLACARLGIALIHSKPYDSPSRGKIERFFRSVRQKFLSCINLTETCSLDDINTAFSQWLDREYHKGFHHGISTRPMDKWMDEIKHTPITRITSHELDLAFYVKVNRRVKNDATISVHGILYEVPPRFIGKKIELRYPSDKPHEITIYEDDKPVCMVKKLNPHENANPPSWGIRFERRSHD